MSQQTDLIRVLRARYDKPDWKDVVPRVARMALEIRRQGAPLVDLAGLPESRAVGRVEGLIPEAGVTVFYGDGGVGKSTVAMLLAGCLLTGHPFLGLPVHRGPVLYVDYESSAEIQARRLRALARGMEWVPAPSVLYKTLYVPFADAAEDVRRQCASADVAVVMIDSLAYAGGGENEAGPTMTLFRALDSLQRPVVVIAHVSKHGDGTKPYGSVFVWNSARSVIEVQKHQEEGTSILHVGLYHRKANDGTPHSAIGARIAFAPGVTTVTSQDLGEIPGLSERRPLPTRLADILRSGALSPVDLAEAVGASRETVDRVLRRLRDRGVAMRLDDGRWGLKV